MNVKAGPTRVLVLTTCYPKSQGDINGLFIEDLNKRLQPTYKIIVLAPWEPGLKRHEVLSGIEVFRHPQFFWPVRLAYGDDIMDKLRQKPWKWAVLPFFLLFQLLYTRKLCRTFSIQLIHAHWVIPSGLIAVIYKLLLNRRAKVLTTAHGSDIWSFLGPISKWGLRWIVKNTDSLVGVSSALVEKLIDLGPKNTPFKGPMGIDTQRFVPLIKNTKGPIPTLLFVGRFRAGKGIVQLLDALIVLNKRQVLFKAIFVGEGLLKEEISAKINAAGLNNKITLAGAVGHEFLPEYYSQADIFILPSHSEGLGLVYLEAMSSGVLTIASPLPTIKDIMKHGQTGIILENLSPLTIANCLEDAILNPEAYREIAERGRQFVVQTFDWEIAASNYNRFYQSTLHAKT